VIAWLKKVEDLLQTAIEGNAVLAGSGAEPLDLVRQIEREIERHKKVFIHDQTYVPHRLVIHLFAPTPEKVEEYEALFNNAEFHKYLEGYIGERGYTLLGPLRASVQCHREVLPEFGKREFFVEFSWPQVASDPGDVTIVVDPQDEGRILSTQTTGSEVASAAWLEVLEGTTYQRTAVISRREFNIGRTEQVVHHRTGALLRTNHLAFQRPAAGDLVNRSVSRRHARIAAVGDLFLLLDSGSENGTKIERGTATLFVQRSTPPSAGIELKDGDVLVLGRARVRFRRGVLPASVQLGTAGEVGLDRREPAE
jgi:hypothetical protein